MNQLEPLRTVDLDNTHLHRNPGGRADFERMHVCSNAGEKLLTLTTCTHAAKVLSCSAGSGYKMVLSIMRAAVQVTLAGDLGDLGRSFCSQVVHNTSCGVQQSICQEVEVYLAYLYRTLQTGCHLY